LTRASASLFNEHVQVRRSRWSALKGNPVRLRCFQPQIKSGAAPATVGGESISNVPLGFALAKSGKGEVGVDPRARKPA
jgi:hypothetical protein